MKTVLENKVKKKHYRSSSEANTERKNALRDSRLAVLMSGIALTLNLYDMESYKLIKEELEDITEFETYIKKARVRDEKYKHILYLLTEDPENTPQANKDLEDLLDTLQKIKNQEYVFQHKSEHYQDLFQKGAKILTYEPLES